MPTQPVRRAFGFVGGFLALFFVLEKFARVVRMSNLEVYAKMRGESFEDFMKTRRVPEAR